MRRHGDAGDGGAPGGDEQQKFDMLITWAKKVPRGLNKVSAKCSVLLCVRTG